MPAYDLAMSAAGYAKLFFRKFPVAVGLIIVLTIVSGLLEVASILLLAPVVDLVAHPDLSSASPLTKKMAEAMMWLGLPLKLTTALGAFLVFTLAKNLVILLARHIMIRTQLTVVASLLEEAVEAFYNALPCFFQAHKHGEMLNALTRGMDQVGYAFQSLGVMFGIFLQVLFCAALPLYISWQVTLAAFGGALLVAGPFVMLAKVSRSFARRYVQASNDTTACISEHLASAKLVLGCGKGATTLKAIMSYFERQKREGTKSMTLLAAIPLVYQPLGYLVVGLALVVALHLGTQLSELVVLLYAFLRMTNPFSQIVYEKNRFSSMISSYDHILSLVRSAEDTVQKSGTSHFEGLKEGLELKNVSFAYTDCEPTLVDISVRIPQGSMTAFVGESGAGKSSLLDVIMGFNEPCTGVISIDGVSLSKYDIQSYREKIGFVPQDSFLFNMTIRENLLWAKPSSTDPEIVQACMEANADEFISQLPEGYETMVGDRGVRLSGGQVQRLALARAILRKPDLLILDEATSSLDSKSERLIHKALQEIARNTTVLIVAHRLSTIINADNICVLRSGTIVEQGSCSELMNTGTHFNQMLRLQSPDAVT